MEPDLWDIDVEFLDNGFQRVPRGVCTHRFFGDAGEVSSGPDGGKYEGWVAMCCPLFSEHIESPGR